MWYNVPIRFSAVLEVEFTGRVLPSGFRFYIYKMSVTVPMNFYCRYKYLNNAEILLLLIVM